MYLHKNDILLRKMEESDLDDLFALKQESWFGTHNVAVINTTDQKKWFDEMSNSNTNLYLIGLSESKKVGVYKMTNIHWINRSYELALDTFKMHRGQGYGWGVLEAGIDFGFEILNMRRVSTEILASNEKSLSIESVFEGSVQEGIKRKAVYKCGSYIDSIMYGMLREEWANSERVKKYNGICNQSYVPK